MDTLDSYQTPSQDWYNDTWLSSLPSDYSSVEGAEGAEGSQSRMQSPSPVTPASCQRGRSLSIAAVRTDSRLDIRTMLRFLPVTYWNGEAIDDRSRPGYIHYSIEWKLCLNGRVTAKDTEPDVVLSPSDLWQVSLRKKLEELLKKKQASKSLRPDETNVAVSVTDRHERDLVKRFDERNVDWTVVEKQLRTWSHLLHSRKRLRVNISFRYLAATRAAEHGPWPRHTRGTRSATQFMLAQRELQLDAEQDSLGQPSIWRHVYNLMRCPGPPCHLGPHCWRDSHGKKHYKLKTHHLTRLIRYVEQGYNLETHEDVPEEIRQQLYAEEQQYAESQKKASFSKFPPIHITNVVPGSPAQGSPADSVATPMVPAGSTPWRPTMRLGIPGPRDDAVQQYTHWQCSQVTRETLKEEYQKVCDITLEEGMDLEQVHSQQDATFYIDKGVKRGVALRFVQDIGDWAQQHGQESMHD